MATSHAKRVTIELGADFTSEEIEEFLREPQIRVGWIEEGSAASWARCKDVDVSSIEYEVLPSGHLVEDF